MSFETNSAMGHQLDYVEDADALIMSLLSSNDTLNGVIPENMDLDLDSALTLLSPSDMEILNDIEQVSDASRSTSSFSPMSTNDETSSGSGDNQSNLCAVCLAPADKHNHYGAQVCGSCRGFFRRTVTNNNADTFVCKKNQTCSIDSKSRKSCAWCRYQKCLTAGMNPKWMMTSQERKQNLEKRRQKAQLERKKQQQQVVTINRPLQFGLCTEEFKIIEALVMNNQKHIFGVMLQLIRQDPTPIRLLRNYALKGQPPDPFQLRLFERNEKTMFEEVAYNQDDLITLDPHDRATLVNGNFAQFFSLVTAMHFNYLDFRKHMTWFSRYLLENAREDTTGNLILDTFNEIQRLNKEIRLDYCTMYVSQKSSDQESERRHHDLILKIQKFPRYAPDTAFDEVLVMLIFMTNLFSPLDLKLRNPKATEQLHQKYVMLLYRYLQFKLGDKACSKFGQGLMLGQLAKEAYAMHQKILPQ